MPSRTILTLLCLLALFGGCDRNPETTSTGKPPVQSNAAVQPPAPKQAASQPSSQPVSPSTQTLAILAWNVESDGSDPTIIAQQLKELGTYDVVCLSEVDPDAFEQYRGALGSNFQSVNGKTGRSDRLQICFNKERFELLEQREISSHRDFVLNNGNHRSPLYVRLKDRLSGNEFIVMTNHLARGKEELRNQQAVGLREWARDQSASVINIGDFNMDFEFKDERGNQAFVEMLRDSVYSWVRPKLIDTNWADSNKDGKDDYPDSMLDFAFTAGPAKEWNPVCRVIVRENDFPDDEKTSDHRPIELRLMLPAK